MWLRRLKCAPHLIKVNLPIVFETNECLEEFALLFPKIQDLSVMVNTFSSALPFARCPELHTLAVFQRPEIPRLHSVVEDLARLSHLTALTIEDRTPYSTLNFLRSGTKTAIFELNLG